jgi:hypothetical protein
MWNRIRLRSSQDPQSFIAMSCTWAFPQSRNQLSRPTLLINAVHSGAAWLPWMPIPEAYCGKMFDMPDNHGATNQFSGGAVWQPLAIDPKRGVLYIGTGNKYTVPASVLACQAQAEAANDTSTVCTPTDDYIDTALALDLQTGRVKWAQNTDMGNVEWAHRVLAYDNWTIACNAAPSN